MSTRLVTTTQYCKISKKKLSRQAVAQAAKKGSIHLLPGVIKIMQVGRAYLLEVSA